MPNPKAKTKNQKQAYAMMAVMLRRIHPLIEGAANNDPNNVRLADFECAIRSVLWFQQQCAAPETLKHEKGLLDGYAEQYDSNFKNAPALRLVSADKG